MTQHIRVPPDRAAELLGRDGWRLAGEISGEVELVRDLPLGLEPMTPLTTRAPNARQRAG